MNKEIIMIEEMRKYFEFSGTISGMQYFLRNLVSSIVAATAGGVITLGIILNSIVIIFLGLALLIPVFWLFLVNIYKRVSAFYPNQALAFTTTITILQFITPFGKGEVWGTLLNIALLVIGLLLIFGNSKVEKHNG